MIRTIEQCDEAVVKHFSGLKLEDGDGNLREVPVVFVSPQKEYSVDSDGSEFEIIKDMLPCFVVFRNGIYPDVYGWRYDNSVYYEDVVYDPKTGKPISGNEVKATEPYNIYYGVRAYYSYHADGAEMNFFLTRKSKRGSYVIIDKEGYDLDFLSYKNPEGTYRTFGEVKEKELKCYTDQYLYKLGADFILDDEKKPVKFNKENKFNLNLE